MAEDRLLHRASASNHVRAATALSFPPMGSTASATPWFVKFAALLLLTMQNSAAALLMRQSRSASSVVSIAQTVVILQECVKLLASLLLITLNGHSLSAVIDSPYELLRSSVPALLYLIQNNLQYTAVSHLDAATYTVTYQLKILSTALLSVCVLKTHLDVRKWVALLMLVVGVTLVQLLDKLSTEGSAGMKSNVSWDVGQAATGLAAVLVATILSGCAGVYTEKILKSSQLSLWVRNAQLAGCSILIGSCGLATSDDLSRVRAEGFFVGYTSWTIASILNNGFGGLLIAAVIKYADNILKNFSTSISIILTTAISANFLGLEVSTLFLLGISLVCYSTFLYSNADPLEWLCKVLYANSRKD